MGRRGGSTASRSPCGTRPWRRIHCCPLRAVVTVSAVFGGECAPRFTAADVFSVLDCMSTHLSSFLYGFSPRVQGRAIACGSVLSGAFLVPLQLGSLARATMSEMSRPSPAAPPPAAPPTSLLAQLGDYGMVDLDAANAVAAPPPPAAALADAPPGVGPRPLAAAAAAVVAVPATAALAAATAAGPASRAWNAAFMDAPCSSCGLRVHQLDARYCRLCGTVLRSPPRL